MRSQIPRGDETMKRAFPILMAALIVTLPAHAPLPVDRKAGPNMAIQGTTFSLNWAGDVAATDLANPAAQVTKAAACWVVPTIQTPPSTADSIAFVGVGGFASGDTALIQAGTRHQMNHGIPTYSAWYEMLPNPIATTNVDVSPEDQVCVTIEQTNLTPEQWTITIDNQRTVGVDFAQQFTYTSSKLTAEWIVERLSNCVVGPGGVRCHFVNLANFGSVTFTRANATINSVNTTIFTAPAFDKVTMLNGLKVLAAVTDQVDASKPDEFTVTYKP
jgi:hypothetical protein